MGYAKHTYDHSPVGLPGCLSNNDMPLVVQQHATSTAGYLP